ncbi:MAG: tetratricopeptide repeat protein [Thermohalobaculum sp.]
MDHLRMIIPALLMAGVLAGPATAGPYDDCVALVATDPARAEVEAQRWAQAGGGSPARHCRALALLALGAGHRAAELMVAIAADDRTLPDQVRSEMLIEAGEIYLGLGELDLGRSVASRALLLARAPRAALTLSARLKAERGDWRGAVNDLDGALAQGEPDAGLLVLRASARLHLGERAAARGDLLQATGIAPELAPVWLERGVLEALSGDRTAARAAWLRAIELDRDGVVGAAARLRLQKMEADAN